MFKKININTSQKTEFIDITNKISQLLIESKIQEGFMVIYVPHTTAAITINENADPDVVKDIKKEINKIVPFDDNYTHVEGNSAAHIKSSIFGVSETIIIENGKLKLGRWQGIYFCEFDGPRVREVHIKLINA